MNEDWKFLWGASGRGGGQGECDTRIDFFCGNSKQKIQGGGWVGGSGWMSMKN